MKTNARPSAWTEEAPVSQPQGRVIRSWKDYSPEIVSLLLTWGICGAVCVVEWARFHRIEYAIDDTYIHMAIAKHLSRNSIWGVTPYEFSSSSSSILYTLLLAALDRLQIQARLVPLFLNLLFASLSLVIFAVLLRRHGVNPRAAVICLVAIVL